jgi:hypothetical protein
MTLRIRRCIECPKCHTRYLIGFSPYRNGAWLVRPVDTSFEEYTLYCSCARPPSATRWIWSELKEYVISSQVQDRGYGSPDEIVTVLRKKRIANWP